MPARRVDATARSGGTATAAIALSLAVAAAPAFAAAAVEPSADATADASARSPTAPPALPERISRALAYEHGEGLPKDEKIAAAIYCEAVAAGNANAAYQLGWMYANGRGVAHDEGTASALFQIAADAGDRYAKAMLDRMGGVHGLLPDCLRPVEPPPPDETDVAEDDGPDPFADLPPAKQKIADLVRQIAPRYGIEPRLALAVIAVESNFDSLARSMKDARGLMQLIPETAARFNVRNPYDMRDNVRGGLAYLRWLLAYYRGEVALAAAAYNAGEGVVDRYRGVPPYPETRAYVQKVLSLFRRRNHPYEPGVVEPSLVTALQRTGPN